MDEYVSISLNKDGTIAFNVTQEQFGKFIRENFEDLELKPLCMMKLEDPQLECKLKDAAVPQCKKDLVPACLPLVQSECVARWIIECIPWLKIRRCMMLGMFDRDILLDINKLGFPLDKFLDAKQIAQIQQIRK